ncbi:MAG: YihY/virulence factor BrkB family protein [Actinomycetota bacterium]|nr:YihY/virulence factor BrkB family protein [Actinomycetota bacterium]
MTAVLDRARRGVATTRRRSPVADHVVRAVQHYGGVQANILAGAVTFFGYLSFFPVLALSFGVMGIVARVYPDARDRLVAALESLFPGLVGRGESATIDVGTFVDAAGTVGVLGAVGLLYTGLGWVSALRTSLQDVFCVPREQQRGLVAGKAVDLLALVAIGAVLLVSVSLSAAVVALTEAILGWLGLTGVPGLDLLLRGLGVALGVAASTLLFLVMFGILLVPDVPRAALLKGAVLAAVAFEALKLVASQLISLTTDNPATAVLGTSLVLLVWINYFARIAMLGAAWAYTAPEARTALAGPEVGTHGERSAPPNGPAQQRQHRIHRTTLLAGVVIGATTTWAWLRRRRRQWAL